MADERLSVRCSAKARLWKAAAIEPSLSLKQAASPRTVTAVIVRIIRRNANRGVEEGFETGSGPVVVK
jgi:hypothetical protein